MVGRLVEQQNVGFLNEQPAKRHAAPLAARQHADLGIRRGAAERIHGQFQFMFQLPAVDRLDLFLERALLLKQPFHLLRRDIVAELVADGLVLLEQTDHLRPPLFHHFLDGLVLIELRLLLQEADRVAFRSRHLTDIVRVDARDDFQQGALAGAVQTQHADLGAVVKAEIDVAQHLLLRGIDLADPDQRKDHLFIVCGHSSPSDNERLRRTSGP